MKREYNELVALYARFSRIIPRYRLTHVYRIKTNGETAKTGSMRGYDMCRLVPIETLMESIVDAYAPAIIALWRQVTGGCVSLFLQFDPDATPKTLGLHGAWIDETPE